MPSAPQSAGPEDLSAPESFEGDYRPSASDAGAGTPEDSKPRALFHPHAADPHIRLEPLQLDFLMRLADALNTTLDLNTLMHRVADLVRAVIDYRIFAILLINDRTHELWMRFQTGHTPEVAAMRIKLGRGVIGQAALHRKSILVEDVRTLDNYIDANPNVRSELAVPLIVKNKVIGVLDIESEMPGYFTQDHQRLLELTASRIGVAVENARLYTRVSRQAQTLTVLHEISREITSILDLDDLLERIGQLLKRVIDFQMFTILLWNDRTEQFEHRFSTRYGERVPRSRDVRLGVGIIGAAAQDRAPVLSPDVRNDPRYIAENPETRAELAVPLIYKSKVIGVIDLEHTKVNYYNEDHQRTLTTLAAQIATSIVNARLYQRIFEDEQRMERDLEMARQVQLRLLPSAPPRTARAEIAASFEPARSIGGDVYDFLSYDTNRTVLALGDVSGKAAPAALYAALVSGILRSLAPQRLGPAELLAALNDQLQERKLDSQYVTMLMALWDDEAQTIHIANAGSVQPLQVYRTSTSLTDALEVHTIEAEGFPLGLFPNASYDEHTLPMQSGDLAVFFSDGIVDAQNSRGEMFGSERLALILKHHPTATDSAQSAVDAILEAVRTFRSGTDHFDDETIVVLRAL
ncbi:sigma-B regulation protein RsbU (phosphoserine phosphatase) [Granulicella rosea]|uniref:Sigma-B regulation protein RsbU (Phosphoserine phosphatase) n=1 Tax=Granulicella rosea TaxID=474952 RepID=A0A239HU15_9BACT|nr:SpoIIE family protein phosphatase [Granulicella rosea]SNS84273.1 sigma-B regulation protein RsbU (phosphoserine phosphatase) [Granulicella rosea]